MWKCHFRICSMFLLQLLFHYFICKDVHSPQQVILAKFSKETRLEIGIGIVWMPYHACVFMRKSFWPELMNKTIVKCLGLFETELVS